MMQFLRQTIEKVANTIALYLPNDALFQDKWVAGTPLRKTLKGWAHPIQDADNKIAEFLTEFNLLNTQLLTQEWAASVGIPDNIYPLNVNNDTLRTYVICKLRSNGVQTIDDFLEVADCLGVANVTMEPDPITPHTVNVYGDDLLTSTIPPLSVPFSLLAGNQLLIDVFESLKPIHVEFIYFNNP